MLVITFEGIECQPTVDGVLINSRLYARDKPVFLIRSEWIATRALHWNGVFSHHAGLVTDVKPYIFVPDTLSTLLDITVIVPNFRTLAMTRRAVDSLRWFYPTVQLIVVDDGSRDASTQYIRDLAERDPNARALILEHNTGHGAALHAGIQMVETARFFAMDSDIVVRRGGFLELMESHMLQENLYALGVMYVQDERYDLRWVLAIASMYDLKTYNTLPPFVHDADPMKQNMVEAQARGLGLACFPIYDYVVHREKGTRRSYNDEWDLTCVS